MHICSDDVVTIEANSRLAALCDPCGVVSTVYAYAYDACGQAFAMLDRDNSGTITMNEVITSHQLLCAL